MKQNQALADIIFATTLAAKFELETFNAQHKWWSKLAEFVEST